MNCLIVGVGGQGAVLASKLIAQAAMDGGHPVRTAETIGMAQRGGSVASHVRVGGGNDDWPASPLIPLGKADCLLAFEPAEAIRALPYLSQTGTAIVADQGVLPVTSSMSKTPYSPAQALDYLAGALENRLVVVQSAQILECCESLKPLNVALLGAACASGTLGIDSAAMKQALEVRVKPRFLQMNEDALALGAKMFEAQARRWRA